MKENRHKKHDKKRKRIQLSLYSTDLKKMKKKYGEILNARQVKDLIMTGEYTRRVMIFNETPMNYIVHNQLIRIGNNLNQLAYIANKENKTPVEALLLRELREIKEVRKIVLHKYMSVIEKREEVK